MLSPTSTADEVVAHLRTLASPQNLAGMARYAIRTDAALGISNPAMQKIARQAGRDHARAMALWRSGVREARMLAIYTADPQRLTMDETRRWADDFASWEIVDAAADLFVATPLWRALVEEFAADEREFVRRAAFAMLAGAAVHLKKEPDAAIAAWLPLIERHAVDPRNFVRKAVNWALRNIGKRSQPLNGQALAVAARLAASRDKTAHWVGTDALRELSGAAVQERLARKAG